MATIPFQSLFSLLFIWEWNNWIRNWDPPPCLPHTPLAAPCPTLYGIGNKGKGRGICWSDKMMAQWFPGLALPSNWGLTFFWVTVESARQKRWQNPRGKKKLWWRGFIPSNQERRGRPVSQVGSTRPVSFQVEPGGLSDANYFLLRFFLPQSHRRDKASSFICQL